MPLSEGLIALIRDEIGDDPDFSDSDPHTPPQLDSLERIYLDPERGAENVLRTALICYRRRLHHLQARSFDITTEGTLLNRRQRVKFMELRIKELAALVDTTYRSHNAEMVSPLAAEEAAASSGSAEFS